MRSRLGAGSEVSIGRPGRAARRPVDGWMSVSPLTGALGRALAGLPARRARLVHGALLGDQDFGV